MNEADPTGCLEFSMKLIKLSTQETAYLLYTLGRVVEIFGQYRLEECTWDHLQQLFKRDMRKY